MPEAARIKVAGRMGDRRDVACRDRKSVFRVKQVRIGIERRDKFIVCDDLRRGENTGSGDGDFMHVRPLWLATHYGGMMDHVYQGEGRGDVREDRGGLARLYGRRGRTGPNLEV